MIQNQAQLPFEETIINCKNEVSYPTFINYSTTYSMKIDINQPNTGQKLFIMRDIGRAFEIVNKGTFDSSQFECLSNILTKQVSVIIGPPGTGKTFVGSMAVKVLVDNYDVWNKQGRPILMICKTNHALDQFLKHILKFEDKIVRIGGRSKEQCLEKYLLGNIKYQYKQSNKKFNTPSLRYLKEQIEEIEELFKQITKEVEDYILLDQDYDIYRKKFDLNLKQMVMNSFQNFVGFRLDYQNRDYYNLQDLILKQWWQCKVDSSEFENFSILTKQQIKIIQDKLNIWIDKMKSQKKQYLEKILNENKIDIQSQDLQNKNHSDANLNEDSDDEENYFENKNEFEVEPSMKIEFLEKQQQNSQFFQVKYNEKELIDLIQNIKLGILNIFNIDYSQAYNLKSYAIQQQQQFALEKIKQLIQNYHLYLQIYNEENSQDDARIILESKCKIIGMTLNGAAINSHLIKHLKSPIIIIEEAGEVLESLLIPVLQPTTQQLILIGDNQQLKPITNNYHLQQYYNFNTSLLERLVKNDVQHAQLKVQRRMNPEFADYIRLIYNQYEDHDDLIRYKKNVVGMPSNMYLISHTQNEDNIENSNSKKNTYEAMYAIKLAKYIIMQKQFKEEEITILSMYLGQCQLIRKLAKQENITQIKISSVDNYQGEENEIVILSLVRSNQNNKLGHAKTQNRINVSFSRAKRGFYVIGNFNMISQVQDAKLWQKIIGLAKKKCHLVESIYFKCNKHKNVNKVTHYQDFDNMVQGGCQKRCNTPLSCGHKCSQICHPDECENYQCINLCKRKIEGCGHECQLNCFEKCKCTSYVQKILLCGHPKVCLCSSDIKNEKCEVKVNVCNNNHKIEVQCFEANLNNLQCKELVSVLPQCGHIKYVKCFQRNLSDHQCVKDILHQLPCKHSVFIKCCDKNKNYECKREVSFKCPKCKISTLKKLCQENSTNVNCTNVIKKKLKCGHYKEVPCNMIPLDATREQEVLKLLKCNCIEQYIFCPHNKYGNKQEQLCNQICGQLLECGHQCQSTCQQCVFGLLHMPCKQKIDFQYMCGHTNSRECGQDPDFCQSDCQIEECAHNSKVCYNKCNEKCSFNLRQSDCDLCECYNEEELSCGHTFYNLDQIFQQQLNRNPLRLPECRKCDQIINVWRFKHYLQDVKLNQYYFSQQIQNIVLDIIEKFHISDEEIQAYSQEYAVFESNQSLFDKFRLCHLYQSIKYLKYFETILFNNQHEDFNTQKVLNTIKLQVEILQNTYLKRNQINLSINHIRKLVNSIIFLTGMYIYYYKNLNVDFNQLSEFRIYQMPQEQAYNQVVYKVFQQQDDFQMNLILRDKWIQPILMPIQMSICPNLHISQEDNQYCVVKCCREQTYTEKFHYIIPE